MITRGQLIEAIKWKIWPLRECSMCGASLHYLYLGECLHFDSGCHCSGRQNMHREDESDLDFYLDPQHGHTENIQKFYAEAMAEKEKIMGQK